MPPSGNERSGAIDYPTEVLYTGHLLRSNPKMNQACVVFLYIMHSWELYRFWGTSKRHDEYIPLVVNFQFSTHPMSETWVHIAWHCHAQRQLHQTITLVVLCTGRSCLFHLSITDRDTRVVMRYLGASLFMPQTSRDLAQSLTTVTDLSRLGRVHVLSLSSHLGSVLFWIFLITSWVT